MLKRLLLSSLLLLSLSAPVLAEIKNIKDLPKVDVGNTDFFDYPFSRPIIGFDSFTEKGKLLVADVKYDLNILGINRAGLVSFWSANKISMVYCTRTPEKRKCTNLNGMRAYVKVDGKVFELEPHKESPYSMPADLQLALDNTKGKAWVRIDLQDETMDKEIGRGTIETVQEIRTYTNSHPCVVENAFCSQ